MARMRRISEAESAPGNYKLMHLSALSPTTRKSHAERHGKLYTAEEAKEFWSVPANRVGCKCSITAVLMDSNGNPVVDTIVLRAKATYEKMKAANGHLWS